MSSQNVVGICNLSLLSIGARAQISSLTEGSAQADACSTLYQFVFENLARTARWNCLRNQATLSLLEAAQGTPENPLGTSLPLPPNPWLYSYALPSDSLAMRFIVPSFPSATAGQIPLTGVANNAGACLPNGGQIPYQVAYSTDSSNNPIEVILTNQTQAQAVYTVNQSNPVIWDSLFTQAMVASLAAYLVPALSLNAPLMQMSIRQAESVIAMARAADGNESVVTQNREASWITARQGESGYWWGSGGGLFGDYGGNMCWPSGG